MKDDNDVFKEFQQSLSGLDGTFHVLETSVPIERQMEYFRYSEKVRANKTKKETVERQIEVLNANNSTYEEVKYAMTFLAISGDVKAYRALETYSKDPQEDLSDWVALSLLQAKITLEYEFSNEKQVFISTGLGGKGTKLRFFTFFKSEKLCPFSKYQCDLIEKEFSFAIHKNKGILEEIKVKSNYFTLLFLIDMQVDIKILLKNTVSECNEYGNFIDNSFIITNVRIYSEEEIQRELRKR
ncbi:MAG: hypothetical protein LBG15_04510 [Dysgonamonadaceae bacterium]|jgi:hypothetical protein|nr:hypothetical protein [Dysgonamonadaceae bacterium]